MSDDSAAQIGEMKEIMHKFVEMKRDLQQYLIALDYVKEEVSWCSTKLVFFYQEAMWPASSALSPWKVSHKLKTKKRWLW